MVLPSIQIKPKYLKNGWDFLWCMNLAVTKSDGGLTIPS